MKTTWKGYDFGLAMALIAVILLMVLIIALLTHRHPDEQVIEYVTIVSIPRTMEECKWDDLVEAAKPTSGLSYGRFIALDNRVHQCLSVGLQD